MADSDLDDAAGDDLDKTVDCAIVVANRYARALLAHRLAEAHLKAAEASLNEWVGVLLDKGC